MTAPLPLDLTARVAKLLPRLASDQQGEVVATAAAISRTLKTAGRDLHDLAEHVAAGPRETVRYVERSNPRPFDASGFYGACNRAHPNAKHRFLVIRCQEAGEGRLSAWEDGFLVSLGQQLARARSLSPKQAGILAGIAERMGVPA